MREFEDYDESLNSSDIVLNSLPPYTHTDFFNEYPKAFVLAATFFAIIASMCFWKILRMRHEEYHHDILRNGRFNHSIMSRIRRKNKSNCTNTFEQTTCVNDDAKCADGNGAVVDEENNGLRECCDFNGLKSQKLVDNEKNFMAETFDKVCCEEKGELFSSIGALHGKLATADLRVKAKKLEKAMSDEERTEEQLIRQKQLESICELILQKPDKFGVLDKTEIMEQMKLYSL